MTNNTIIQSENDTRLYESFTLENQLEVLIISDPDEDKAAASLDVFVGSASDPEERAGLAHFLEHMLFLGTEKYPDPNEYMNFIAQHGGSRNAYTAKEHTNYFFDIENKSLEPMLDRFSQFFIAPLFNPEFVEREKNAVHSEYLGKIKTDSRRFYAAMQQAFNPKSPYAKFSVGSLETLADRKNQAVRDDLLSFYKTHYSANKMRLVVLGNEPLPTLKKWVNEKFSAIPNTHAKKAAFTEPLISKNEMAKWINIESLQAKRELALLFPLPETQSHYLAKPSAYFQSLLGHEGKGSVLALLKAKGWADEMSASTGFSHNQHESSLYLGINLTQEGLNHADAIIDIVFQYIRLMQKEGVQKWLFKEQQQMADLRFRYQEKRSASHTVTDLARNMHYYPTQDVLRGNIVMKQFKPELSTKLLQHLSPERVLISLHAQQLKTDKTEKNYHVDYSIKALTAEQLSRWSNSDINAALALPSTNPFIPNKLSLHTESNAQSKPLLIKESHNLALWHQLDTQFKAPRSSLYLALHNPEANQSPKESLLSALLTGMIKKQLNSYAYPANLAGLNYSIYTTERGLSIQLSGYSQKQAVLLDRIIAALKQPEMDQQRFDILKNKFQQDLHNAKKQQPFHQVLAELKRSLVERRWTNEQKLEALVPLTLSDLTHFSEQFLQNLRLTLLVQGNTSKDEALALAQRIKQQLPVAKEALTIPAAQTIKLPINTLVARKLNIDNNDATLALYFQAKDNSIMSQAESQLLGRILSSAFFADLRTRQQLGYNIGAASLPMKDSPGIIFILQSPVISAVEIEARIRAFILDYQEQLSQMPETEFNNYKAGLITRLLEKDKSLQKLSHRNWLEIDRENANFDTKKKIAEAIKSINKQALLTLYQELFVTKARVFRSYALGKQFNKNDFSLADLMTDIGTFKQDSEKY
ncbi:MAG: insulinase family protein [Methyloprofundus sp.]|nr:insulinase family protein [Methyloprofundus sp.]